MEIIVTDSASNSEWNSFVENTEESHYTQSGLWAQVREVQGWRSYQIYVQDGGGITAGAQLLIRPLKNLGWAGYIPHGLLNPGRLLALDEQLIQTSREICRQNQIHYLALPYWSGKSQEYLDLERLGFKPSILGNIDPPCTNYVDLTPDLEKIIGSMDRNKRNQVRASQKRDLVFREGTRAEIEEFYHLHILDGQRIGYVPFKIEFFFNIWDIYHPRGKAHLFLTELDGKTINAAIFIAHRDTLVAYKIGWSGEERNRYPNEAIHWGAMVWAKAHGYRIYDFGGFETWALETVLKGKPYSEKFLQSYAYFKYQMANAMEVFPPIYDYVPNPFLRWGYRSVVPLIRDASIFRKIVRSYKRSVGTIKFSEPKETDE